MAKVTMESFGSNLPDNWEELAAKLNRYIDELGIENDQDACNEAWDKFFAGEIVWYAVMSDREDTDWGTGSYIREKAVDAVRDLRRIGRTDAYVLAVQDGEHPVALREVEVD